MKILSKSVARRCRRILMNGSGGFLRSGSQGGQLWRRRIAFADDEDCGEHDRTWPEGACSGAAVGAWPGPAADGGRKLLVSIDPKLPQDLNAIVEADAAIRCRLCAGRARACADSPLSCRRGHAISRTVVGELLKKQKFSLQVNRKTREGGDHPDRDEQFNLIKTQFKAALAENQPEISLDTKKRELVGDFKNAGREWRPQGEPEEVRVHVGRAVPYGVHDLAANAGWVSVGIDNDTAAFSVNTIRRWCQEIGNIRYPDTTRLVIAADGGGSNGLRVRLWKHALQLIADELGISIEVHHLPH